MLEERVWVGFLLQLVGAEKLCAAAQGFQLLAFLFHSIQPALLQIWTGKEQPASTGTRPRLEAFGEGLDPSVGDLLVDLMGFVLEFQCRMEHQLEADCTEIEFWISWLWPSPIPKLIELQRSSA